MAARLVEERQRERVAIVALGGGSPIDAAKVIALAAVNPQHDRNLDHRDLFKWPALPIVAIPTTAGTGAETNSFGVITDPKTQRKFYVGDPTTRPHVVILDPYLTTDLPPPATAATGMDALIHSIESYLSIRANPWSDPIARDVISTIVPFLPRAVADGTDLKARYEMLLAAHKAGIGMENTGLGLCHAIGHPLGARFDIAHGVALTMVLPSVLRFNLPACELRLAELAFACGAGNPARGDNWNAKAAIDAIASLAERIGMTRKLADFGVTEADFSQIAADALNDLVLASTPRRPTEDEIFDILAGK